MGDDGRLTTDPVEDARRLRVLWLDNEMNTILLRATQGALKRQFALWEFKQPAALIKHLSREDAEADVLLLDVIFDQQFDEQNIPAGEGRRYGLGFVRKLRHGDFGARWERLPVVILTASAYGPDLEDIRSFIGGDAGRSVLRSKPILIRDLANVIRQAAEGPVDAPAGDQQDPNE